MFYFSNCFKVLEKTFNTLNLNCQNEYMITIKCLNKNQVFFFFKYAGKENCTKNFQPFVL